MTRWALHFESVRIARCSQRRPLEYSNETRQRVGDCRAGATAICSGRRAATGRSNLMPRKSRVDELREKYEAAIEKGLVSESAAERTQALVQAGNLLSPALGELRDEIKSLTKRLGEAETALKAVVTERDPAQGVLCLAIQSALQGSAAKAELADLRMNFDS